MANIIEKTFDVSKNIVRTIFLGKPNLFTTSDLNRQIQAFKYQMDSIEKRLGAESDMEIDVSSSGIQICCTVTKGTYFRVNGLNIPLPDSEDMFAVNADYGQEVYFYVWGKFARKTYANDPTHEIAGAKFSDGTSMPAADQLVLSEVHYAMTDDLGDITRVGDDFSFLIAKANVFSVYDKYIHVNYKPVGSSVMMDSATTLENVDPISDNLAVGDTFTRALRKVRNAITELKSKMSSGFLCCPAFVSINVGGMYYPKIAKNHSYEIKDNARKVKYVIHGGHIIIRIDNTSVFPFDGGWGSSNDFTPEESGDYVYLGSITDSDIIDVLNTYKSKGFGDTIDLGIVGYTHAQRGGESECGVWAPISLQVVYMGNVSGSATYSDWVILLRMKTGFSLLAEGPTIATRSRWWPESNGAFVVEKTVSTFPIGIFIGESTQFIHI